MVVCLFFLIVCINKKKILHILNRFLSRLLIVDPNRICSKVNRLRSRQVYICKREPTIISQIINGSIESVRECHYQFADRKWNCPTKNKRSMRKLLGKGMLLLMLIFLLIKSNDLIDLSINNV